MDKIKNNKLYRHSCEGRNLSKKYPLFQKIPAKAGIMEKLIGMTFLLGGLLLIFSSCSGPSHKDHGPLAEIEKHSNAAIDYTVSSAPFTYGIEKVAVTNSENDTLFFTPNRTNHILSFPCNNCHTQPLSKMASNDPSGKKAHWNFQLNHATEEALTCLTCHSSNDVEYLRLNNNKKVGFNKSQKVCAQCHSTQYNDWVGGAHGKKLGGWAPPRVSNTCVNCHNPHSPGFETRWPSRLNTIKIQELDPK
ncbi:MAG: cytochrome c family protein [Cyclobacteriaceae bacterium]|nr:cytochrome c family protein [Cyclobacteriaceae bacterium]